MSVTRDQIIAVLLLKWFRRVVDNYAGPDDLAHFREYIHRYLDEKNFKADRILAEAAEELF